MDREPTTASPLRDEELARLRAGFPILARTTYMNSNSMGAMHVDVRAGLQAYADEWEREGVEAWDTWPAVVDATADGIAALFGGLPGETTLNQNVAFFMAQVASCFDYRAGRPKVVVESLMFPNVLYVWERYASLGAELELVPSDDGATIALERMLGAIDERTAIVPLSHAVYVSGALHDVKAIVRRAHEVGALVLLDVYQTLGVVPFDARELGVDMVVGGCHKWMCGGPGTCFLWMDPAVRERLAPRLTGWMGHAEPFAFEPPPIRYAAGGWRFMGGTPSMPAYYVAQRATALLAAIGLERIAAHNRELCELVIARAQAAGLQIRSPLDPAARTGFIAVDFPGSQAASRALIAEHYKHDWRPGCGLRIGPHVYNTADEVHRFMDRVVELARAHRG
jgi:kynureninase